MRTIKGLEQWAIKHSKLVTFGTGSNQRMAIETAKS